MIWWQDAINIVRATALICGPHPATTSVPRVDFDWWADDEEGCALAEQLYAIYIGLDETKYPSWWKQGHAKG